MLNKLKNKSIKSYFISFFEFLILLVPIIFSLPKEYFPHTIKIVQNNTDTFNIILIVILFISIVVRHILNKKLSYADYERNKFKEIALAYRTIFGTNIDYLLKGISEELKFTKDERITVFVYSATLDKFFSIGRYSFSEKYKKIGRLIIEDTDEYVYKIINEENHHNHNPKYSKERKMQSKSMYGTALMDENNMNTIGVMVFQSMKNKKFYSSEKRKELLVISSKVNDMLLDMNLNPNEIKSSNNPIGGM